ncbi:integral membrane protein [Neofusicoccum parvum]|nr:integral membrane protein [Neofusicoccum parvum]
MLLESLRPPLELVLAWQTSQFPHGIRRGWGLVALIGFFAPISLMFVVLRLQLRIRRRSFGIDDALMVFAMLFAAGVDTCIILGSSRLARCF